MLKWSTQIFVHVHTSYLLCEFWQVTSALGVYFPSICRSVSLDNKTFEVGAASYYVAVRSEYPAGVQS